ncbi:hypothetical protein [Nostoc sp.]|uniref:hypothetical protein n=1 Tax=Nostoc sp. TaxID=1180 RepID=UPI002FF748D1
MLYLPPANVPTTFGFNWVDDEDIQGVMAIQNKLSAAFIVQQLNPILKTLCPVIYCKADGAKSPPYDVVIQLNPGSDHTFNQTSDAQTGLIASYSYNPPPASNTDTGPPYAPYTFQVSGQYSSTTNVYFNGDKITISGSITANGSTYTQVAGSHSSSEVDMPNTTYNWSVDLQLYMDASNNGQLDLKVVNPDFNRPPVVEQHDTSWWEKFLESLSGFMQSYTQNLGDLRGQIQGSIESSIVPNLKQTINQANHFVFPGGKTFSFKDPTFTNNKDLATNITYLNPNA